MIFMRVVIDADACPVTDIALGICRERGIPCLLVFDNSHFFDKQGAQCLIVDKGADSADLKIANTVSRGDIVITQDYGLAAMCLGKGARALNQNGLIFSDKNIETLLYSRFVNKKIRQSGQRTKGPSKRTADNDTAFIKAFTFLLEEI